MKKFLSLILLSAICGCSRYSSHLDPLVAIQIQDRNGVTETISTPERLEIYEQDDFLAAHPYKKVLRVYRKNKQNYSLITAYHPNGTIAQYLEAEEMRAHGAYREWFPNGQLHIEAFVIGGTADITLGAQKDWLFDKISTVWDEQGHLIATIPYDKGVVHGISTYFYPTGAIQKQIPFVKNLEEGEAFSFYENGSIQLRTNYAKGKKQGASLGFFENKQISWMEEYADGLLLKGLYYTPQGQLISQVEDGRGQQALYSGTLLTHLVEIRQGVAEGIVKKFTPQKELQNSYHIKNDRKHGEEIEYYPSTDKELHQKLSIQWDQDTIHGIVKTWYPNGQLQSQREYCHNKKLGPSCAWYKNGALMFVEEYEEGKLMRGSYYKKNQNDPVSTIIDGNGTAYLYDEEGIFIKKIVYVKGKPTDPED